MDEGFNLALGGRLRAARRHRGFSLTEVERISNQEFKASVLGAYERGERALSVHRLCRLADIYGIAVHQLIPPNDEGSDDDGEPDKLIDLTRLGGFDQSAVVERFLASIHLMRTGESSLAVRSSDMAILNSMLASLVELPTS